MINIIQGINAKNLDKVLGSLTKPFIPCLRIIAIGTKPGCTRQSLICVNVRRINFCNQKHELCILLGTGCTAKPPDPPPEHQMKLESSWVMDTSLTGIDKTVTYICNAGGLNWRMDQIKNDKFKVKCIEELGNEVKWEEPSWPTCSNSEISK